jgi:hypothetical protein
VTRVLRQPRPARTYSYTAPEAPTMVLPVIPQAAPRRERYVGRWVVALLVGLPAGGLIGGLLFVAVLAYLPGVLL